jgi:RNA polymerase sigma-70 factor (ECF subfamily)
MDRLRRAARYTADPGLEETTAAPPDDVLEALMAAPCIEDDRLRLIFTCCHPAINEEAQMAMTLRTLGGLTTPEIASAFLVPETTLAQRIVRAKNKIRVARIPYEVPRPQDLPGRLKTVLHVLYLIFNEGYLRSNGDTLLRTDLCEEAIRLARILWGLMPHEPEAGGVLALLLLHHSRRATRTGSKGDLITLEAQDRSRWDASMIAEGKAVLEQALRQRAPGPYQIQAAIAALHAEAATPEATDWKQIARLYQELECWQPTRIVSMNRAVAVAMAWGIPRGLAMLDHLNRDGSMDEVGLFHAARADLFRRLERWRDAEAAYRRALEFTTNAPARRYLEARLASLPRD